MRHILSTGTFLAASFLAVALLSAADVAQRVKTFAPFVDESVMAVAYVDLQQENPAAPLIHFTQLLAADGAVQSRVSHRIETLRNQLHGLKDNGAAGIYLFFLPGRVLQLEVEVAVSLRENADADKVKRLLFSGRSDGPADAEQARQMGMAIPDRFDACRRIGDVLFCGRQDVAERAEEQDTALREELVAALEAAGEAPYVLAIAPSGFHRRAFSAMLERLPAPLEQYPVTLLSEQLKWIAVSAQGNGRAELALTAQASDARSAGQLQQLIRRSLEKLANAAGQDADALLDSLTPQQQEARLVLRLEDEARGLDSLAKLLAPQLTQLTQHGPDHDCLQHLKQLALAMHNFHDIYGSFPPSASYSKDGKKLLSWRVYLLPFVEEQKLFEQFRLDEPWDSAHNLKLLERMPEVFACRAPGLKPGHANLVAPVGEKLVFTGGKEGLSIREITDGTSNTIMLVEVDVEHAVPWTKPDDLNVDLQQPRRGLISGTRAGFHAAYGDGSARFIPKEVTADTVRGLLTRSGGEVLKDDAL